MKILVIGLDCAAPDILFGDDRLTNIRRLMDAGCYGRLESVIPPITVPAWMCMATSRDPGSLGVYGFRNRADHGYGTLATATSRSIDAVTIWDRIAMAGGRAVVVGVPPSYPPRRIAGAMVGCFLTPDTAEGAFTHPPELSDEIRALIGEYPVDVKGFRTDDKAWLRDQIYDMTRRHFRVVRHLMQHHEWDYFQFVEIGVDRIHHGFWKYHDPAHRDHRPGNEYEDVIRDYYRYVDQEIGSVLDLVDDETVVLVASDHGARALDGGFCVNEWLIEQEYLRLRNYPNAVTPLDELDVDWSETVAWGEGGYYARVFLNVRGREPDGLIDPDDYFRVRDELAHKLEATVDDRGRPLGTVVHKPDEIYRDVTNIAPDLIVHFGDLAWRSVGRVGYRTVHVHENDTGPDDCNHAQFGAFILSTPNPTLRGELTGVHLLDVAPTLLHLAGYDVPSDFQGRALTDTEREAPPPLSEKERDAVRRRLSGLGYLG